jgi:hypothetical protein
MLKRGRILGLPKPCEIPIKLRIFITRQDQNTTKLLILKIGFKPVATHGHLTSMIKLAS